MALITKPAEIVEHIITEEVGASVNVPFYVDDDDIDLAFTVHNKQINSKKLIEGVSSNSRMIPYFKNNELKFGRIKPDVQPELEANGGDVRLYIDQSEIISYNNKRTAPEKVYTEVVVEYLYDYASEEFTKNTKDDSYIYDTATQYFGSDPHNSGGEYNIANVGLTEEQDYKFEAKYIRSKASAEAFQQFLLLWHCNQHNILRLKLPLKYIQLKIGDYVGFNELINGVKLFGEDYSIKNFIDGNRIFRNAQQILPVWMIVSTKKTLTHIDVELIQMHNCSPIATDSVNFPPQIDVANLTLLPTHPSNPVQIEGHHIAIYDTTESFDILLSYASSDVNNDTLVNELIFYDEQIPEGINASNFSSDVGEDNSEVLGEVDGASSRLTLGVSGNDGGDDEPYGSWFTDWRDNAVTGDSITFPTGLFKIRATETETEDVFQAGQLFPAFTIHKDVLPGLATATIDYSSDWQLVSMPLLNNEFYTNLFPDAIEGSMYSFSDTYHFETEFSAGVGYWIRFNQAGSVDITGVPFEYPVHIPVTEGWNLVGVPSINPISASVYYDSGYIVPSAIYSYETNYTIMSAEDNLIPGKGYWMRASETNIITINPNA